VRRHALDAPSLEHFFGARACFDGARARENKRLVNDMIYLLEFAFAAGFRQPAPQAPKAAPQPRHSLS
jgi:hypothetical protein